MSLQDDRLIDWGLILFIIAYVVENVFKYTPFKNLCKAIRGQKQAFYEYAYNFTFYNIFIYQCNQSLQGTKGLHIPQKFE